MQHCKICGTKAIINGYCKEHFIQFKESVYLDNSNHNDLGFFVWAKDMFKENLDNDFATFHKTMIIEVLELFNPKYTSLYHRLLNIISFRESAKSTIYNYLFALYILVHNGKIMKCRFREVSENKEVTYVVKNVKLDIRYMVVASKTGELAEEFVVRARNALEENPNIKFFYKAEVLNAKDADTGQWTKNAFKYNGLYYHGIGTQKQFRGRIKNTNRPDIVFFDDLYDEENIDSPGIRNKIRKWFNAAAKNSINSKKGMAILTGTILHQDTVNIDCSKNKLWKTLWIYPMPYNKWLNFLSKYIKINVASKTCILPYDEIEEKELRIEKQKLFFKSLETQENWELAWANRVGLYDLILKFQDFISSNTVNLFYQEYFHKIIPPHKMRFTESLFKYINNYDLKYEYGFIWLYCKELSEEPIVINTELGIDMAGISETGDNFVLTPIGITAEGKIIVFKQHIDNYGHRDIIQNNYVYSTIEYDRSKITNPGFMDESARLYQIYRFSKIKIGISGSENQLPYELLKLLNTNQIFCQVFARPQHVGEGTKSKRITDTLLHLYQAGMIYHCKGNELLEDELIYLTKFTSDDCADSLEVAVWNCSKPPNVKYSYFKNLENANMRNPRTKTNITLIEEDNNDYDYDIVSDWRV